MQSLVDRSTAQRCFVMWLLTGFAVSALWLAGVGVYERYHKSVVQWNREIGLRMVELRQQLRSGWSSSIGVRLAAVGTGTGTLGRRTASRN